MKKYKPIEKRDQWIIKVLNIFSGGVGRKHESLGLRQDVCGGLEPADPRLSDWQVKLSGRASGRGDSERDLHERNSRGFVRAIRGSYIEYKSTGACPPILGGLLALPLEITALSCHTKLMRQHSVKWW